MNSSHRIVINIILFACSILLLVCNAVAVNEQMLIASKFPGYHILSTKELDKTTFDYFKKNNVGLDAGIIKTDIDGNGFNDIAVLLKSNDSNYTKLVILLCISSTQCDKSYELNTSPHHEAIYLSIVKSGTMISQTEAIDNKDMVTPLKLIHDGIRLIYFGKAEIVLFWDSKLNRMISVQTAD